MTQPSQNAKLLAYLESHDEGISTLEAMEQLRICRLSERVRELEAHGIVIEHEPERSNNARFIRYRLLRIAYG